MRDIQFSSKPSDDVSATKEGITMTVSAMYNGLEKHQLTQFVPEEGEPTDTSRMTDEKGEGIAGGSIALLLSPGWVYRGNVVVRAQVRVR